MAGETSMLYPIDPLIDTRWSALVKRHPRASVFHTTGWLEALHQTYGYTPLAYTSSPPGSDLQNGVVFCRVDSWLTGRRLVSLPFSDHCEPLLRGDDDVESLRRSLGQIRERDRARYIEFRPQTDSRSSIGQPPYRTYC